METVTVYVPTGIQFVVNSPEVLVVPVTEVAITPPLIVIVAPLTTAPVEVTTFAVIFPAVASGMLSVAVVPLVTPTPSVRGKYPVALPVMFCVPAVTLLSVYTPLLFVVVEPPLQLTVAPTRIAPLEMLVTFPVTVPPAAGLSVKLAVLVAPPFTLTLCVTLWNPLADATNWTVPVGTPVNVYPPEVLVVVVPPP